MAIMAQLLEESKAAIAAAKNIHPCMYFRKIIFDTYDVSVHIFSLLNLFDHFYSANGASKTAANHVSVVPGISSADDEPINAHQISCTSVEKGAPSANIVSVVPIIASADEEAISVHDIPCTSVTNEPLISCMYLYKKSNLFLYHDLYFLISECDILFQ